MKLTSIDNLIKSILLKKGYPLHFYLPFMVSARDIVQTLAIDDGLIPPNTAVLAVDNNGEAILPCDFIDLVHIGIMVGQYVRPLVYKSQINTYPNRDSSGNIIPYTDSTGNAPEYGYLANIFYNTSYYSDKGEFLGRQNIGAGIETDTYNIDKVRGVIKVNELMANSTIIITYLSDGCGNCTTMGIDPIAKDVIEAYMLYDRAKNKRNPSIGEWQLLERVYINRRRVFRARKNTMGIEELRRAIQRAYYISPKI